MKPVPGGIAQALAESLAESAQSPLDGAVVSLAYEYAATIDNMSDENRVRMLGVLGPSLLKCLIELGLTPAARSAVKGVTSDGNAPKSELDKARDRRANRAPSVHPTPA